jgi:homeobox protein cut-like
MAPATPGTTPGTPGTTPGGGTSAAAGAGAFGLEPIASSSADDAFKLVCGQRERARRQVQDLEVEMAKLAAISHGHQAEARRLQADNLKLYEKVKFLQSTVAAAGHSRDSLAATPIGRNSIEEQATEGRYQKMYEEKVNPFAAFHQRERQQRYAELPAPEKLMLNFSQFFLANRHARLFLFGYMVCLHLLVSGAMYAASHHC